MKLKDINLGTIFVGVILLIVAAYIFMTTESLSAMMFGGGIIAGLGIIIISSAFIKNKKK